MHIMEYSSVVKKEKTGIFRREFLSRVNEMLYIKKNCRVNVFLSFIKIGMEEA